MKKQTTKNGGRWKKGESGNPAGRRPGSKNKIPRDLKAKVLHAWEELEKHGKSLADIAQEHPKWFYELIKGMLPKDLVVRVIRSWSDLSDEEREALLKEAGEIAEGK